LSIGYGFIWRKGVCKIKSVTLSRIAKETNIIRLTFLDHEDNYVQMRGVVEK
jgi:hypothetical protein